MAIELRWIASAAAGSLYACQRLLEGAPLVDRAAADALAGAAAALSADLASASVEIGPFFDHAIPLATSLPSPEAVAQVALAKAAGSRAESSAPRLALRIRAIYAAFAEAHPDATDELELRGGPIGSQWEARGPGLMAGIKRLTESELVVDAADAILVHPVLGGGGAAYPAYNAVCVEAVLANPIADLPEVVRLGWLVAQLNFDLPRIAGEFPPRRLMPLAGLAMIPPVLSAAQDVELARFDLERVERALAGWSAAPADPETLLTWWETYQATAPPWPVALAALERLLA